MLPTTFRFYLHDFQLNTDFPSEFCGFFTVKSPSVTQRSVAQENVLGKKKTNKQKKKKKNKNKTKTKQKKKKNPQKQKTRRLFFFSNKSVGSHNSFTLIENNFRFVR